LKRADLFILGIVFACLPSLCVAQTLDLPHGTPHGKKALTLQEVGNPSTIIEPGISAISWRPGGKKLTEICPTIEPRGVSTLCEYDLKTQRTIILFHPEVGKEKLDLDSYQWSPRGDAILLQGENDLWLLDPNTASVRKLTKDGVEKDVPTFSPSGDRIAYVENHNLFIVEIKTGLARQLTHDGSDTVYNGRLDWVYEEELANRSTARSYEWSPDGKRIAYLRLDDGPVPDYPITDYLATHVSLVHERFPQSGDPNPLPSMHVVTIDEPAAKSSVIKLDRKRIEYFGPSFTWTPDGAAVCFLSLNRDQTEVTLHRWQPRAGTDQELLVERDPYWVNSLEPPKFIQGGREFLWVSERDGWQHIYLYTADGKLEHQITRGTWIVDKPIFQDAPLFQLDVQQNWLYFASTNPDPRERQLYRIHLDGTGMERISQEQGSHTLDLSPDGRYMIDRFSTPDTTPVTRLLISDGTYAATLDSPVNHLTDYALGQWEDVELKAKDGTPLYARLLKPANFDPAKKYPVIVDVYGGPHVQLVQKQWDGKSLYEQLLAQNGFLVWTLDNRGSWGRGHAFESVIFENMGKHELEDQLTGVNYLKSLPYVDGSRIGLRGWSYGGYMTLYALTHAPYVFRCGAAGAPVTDWKFYDTTYTERYMRTPKENPAGYAGSSPLEAAGDLKAKLLILHGTSDDNVHLQNTINFIDALIRAGKTYELHLQPGQKHGFNTDAAIRARDQRILEFFESNLKGKDGREN
jgi:dipeptidyl-peptidase 4